MAAGIVVMSAILVFVLFILRRRRRQRLDRDVAAAAFAAAAAADRSAFDDDEEKGYGGNFFAVTDLHGEPQPGIFQQDFYDPAGGYDAYAQDLAHSGQLDNRASTATAAGLAGFGAQSATHGYDQYGQQPAQEYEELVRSTSGDDNTHPQADGANGYYFDPKQVYEFTDEDPYGAADEFARPSRVSLAGSVVPVESEARGLRVANN